MSLFLFSPIRPMRTGTADYFDLVLADLASRPIDRSRIAIVVDDHFIESSICGREYFGFPVLSYRQVPHVVPSGHTHVYFLANNEFHGYCFAGLSQARKLQGGRIVSVVHEPCCFMLLNTLCATAQHSFDDTQLVALNSAQFGDKAKFFVDARRQDRLHYNAEFMMHCQTLALQKSDEIWTHSRFSAMKLHYESNSAATPHFVISQHPHFAAPHSTDSASLPPSLRKKPGGYRIGLFGWVSPCKRTDVAIRAFALALQTMPREQGERAELVIVGKLPHKDIYDPVGVASALGVLSQVKFLDYVPTEQFELLIESCDLLLNLRFPSCGESSGTLERAIAARIPVVTTRYQSFAEAPASAFVSSYWPRELSTLYSLLPRLMMGDVSLQPPRRPPARPSIGTLISQLFSRSMEC
jgi:glycosyltransferase involved in cell wall biosynthesis